jgi:serine/threonine protein kinase
LKPENVLIDAQGYALLTDFGLSKENMSSSARAKSLCGTAEYLAPEVLEKDRAYSKCCDWWSFGCVIYEMLTGHPPFYSTDRKKMFEDIKSREVKFYDFHNAPVRDLLSRLLMKDPTQRLCDPEKIMKHEFFASIDWERMYKREVTTPYIPVLKDPTDTSHFDTE